MNIQLFFFNERKHIFTHFLDSKHLKSNHNIQLSHFAIRVLVRPEQCLGEFSDQ